MTNSQPSFWKQYKGKIIGTIITILVAGAVPTSTYLHSAWGDDRYISQTKDLRNQIQAIDNALFEVNQEISFAETDREKRKYIARKEYYVNLKEALKEELRAKK